RLLHPVETPVRGVRGRGTCRAAASITVECEVRLIAGDFGNHLDFDAGFARQVAQRTSTLRAWRPVSPRISTSNCESPWATRWGSVKPGASFTNTRILEGPLRWGGPLHMGITAVERYNAATSCPTSRRGTN